MLSSLKMNSTKKRQKPREKPYSTLENREKSVSSLVTVVDNFELSSLKFGILSTRSREAIDIVKDGVLSELDEYLSLEENRKTIDNLDEAGTPLLHYAVRSNLVDVTKMLIDHGANVDVKSQDGSTPLHVAARFNCCAVAELLLQRGANPALTNVLSNTPLHNAVRRSNKEVVDLLIRRTDVDINAKTNCGVTPLHLVSAQSDLEICQLLLCHGADIHAKTADSGTALHSAVFSCNTEVAEMLIKRAASAVRYDVADFVNETDSDQDTALHLAVETGNIPSVELCLKYGAKVNAQRATLMTPLHQAAMKGDHEIVEILCKAGADFCIRDNEKQTALHRAAAQGHADIIKFLLGSGAPIDIKAKDNRTPFLTAVAAGQVESAKALLELGADAEACTSLMENCIHLAVCNSHLGMVQLLIENTQTKRNLYRSDVYERLPIHYGAIMSDVKILELLLTKYSRASFQDQNQQTPLHLAAQSGRVEHVEALGKVMSGVNERDDLGRTPIHLAAMNGNRKVCCVLAQIGADVNARDNGRWTPLMWAARSGCKKTCKELLDRQAAIDHVNTDGNTAFHIACSRGKIGVVDLLLNAGASVCLHNYAGQSCLEVTVQSGAGDVALTLAKHKRWPEILDCRTATRQPPMKILIEHFPEAAEIVMDHCIKRSSHIPTDPSYTVEYNFHLLDPGPDDEANLLGNRFFGPTTMVQFNRENLLLHPLTKKLLEVKWASFGQFIYYFNLMTYMIFLVTYTVFVISEREAQDFNPTKNISNGTNDGQFVQERVTVEDLFARPTAFNGAVLFIALIFAGAHIAKEIFQMIFQRKRYFTDPSNITEWALYLSTLAFMLPYFFTGAQLDRSFFGDLQDPRNLWIAGIISIFLCYLNVVLFLRRFNVFGIYVSMFLEVTVTLVRVMLVFSIFIISFAIVFFILFKEQDSFRSIGFAIIRVSVMMIGEFDYDATFVNTINEKSDKNGNPLNPFPEFGLTFMMVFLFVMSIILMNLLVGLAVGDIESVRRNATLQRMAMQVSFVAEVEDKYPRFITRRVYNPGFTVKPNETRSKIRRFHEWVRGRAGIAADFVSLTSREEDPEASFREIRQELYKTKKRVKTLVQTIETQNKVLVSMARKMNLEIEDEELDSSKFVEVSQISFAEEQDEKDNTIGMEDVRL